MDRYLNFKSSNLEFSNNRIEISHFINSTYTDCWEKVWAKNSWLFVRKGNLLHRTPIKNQTAPTIQQGANAIGAWKFAQFVKSLFLWPDIGLIDD